MHTLNIQTNLMDLGAREIWDVDTCLLVGEVDKAEAGIALAIYADGEIEEIVPEADAHWGKYSGSLN